MLQDTIRPDTVTPIPLSQALAVVGLSAPGSSAGIAIGGVAMSSGAVRAGDLYLGVPGARFHGAAFSVDAAERGAVAVLTDAAGAEQAARSGLPVIVSDADPRTVAGALAACIYGTDRDRPTTFGITGTNGKTSTAHILDALLHLLGRTTGLSTTAERRIGDEVIVSHLTTPEAPDVHALLARMHERGVDAAILEVSAHALTRHRVDGVRFDVAGFTNLSHDHLDDYASMDDYLDAKQLLFTPQRSDRAVVSLDSEAGGRVAARSTVPVVTITSRHDVDANWHVEVAEESVEGLRFTLSDTVRTGRTLSARLPLIGRHMAANAGLALVMLLESGVPFDRLGAVLADEPVIPVRLPGRSVRVSGPHAPTVLVDSGHTPDAFEKTLAALRAVTPGRVIMVTGADGLRDPSKREAMGAAAARGSDEVIITDHHSRTEDPASIRAALRRGAADASPSTPVSEIPDPVTAIRCAIERAEPGDSVLWSGLASQDYRAVGTAELPFSAIEESRRALAEAGWDVAP
ncbi:Mur ligase family protein [Mycetocola reblochoni]|nr:UDP-N-acetylmuramoyl-L-alanyl-D-glutamate--2,6-diaminopimelate ligase [Mycetocola reblochoni]RLP70652.1 UDP-N-acetylmuramoyl-L-alanyl-D-glutamate--2,6-diaminopimelate ligase [Mycetocola reblochoni]